MSNPHLDLFRPELLNELNDQYAEYTQDYYEDIELPKSQKSYSGSLREAFCDQAKMIWEQPDSVRGHRMFWDYSGSDVDPFMVYSKVTPLLKTFTIAQIAGNNTRSGRMEVVLPCLKELAGEFGFRVKVESILNPYLSGCLLRHGFTFDRELDLAPDMSWNRDCIKIG